MQGWNLFYPHILALRVWHYSCACIAYFIFFICNTDPACAEYDMLETGLHTATVPDNYCGREGTSMLISATQVKCLV